MGDGRVALVLDVLGLAQRASVISGAKSSSLGEHEKPSQQAVIESHPLLLFAPSAGGQMAIPLFLLLIYYLVQEGDTTRSNPPEGSTSLRKFLLFFAIMGLVAIPCSP